MDLGCPVTVQHEHTVNAPVEQRPRAALRGTFALMTVSSLPIFNRFGNDAPSEIVTTGAVPIGLEDDSIRQPLRVAVIPPGVSAEYLTKGVYRITLRSDRHVRGMDDVFYTGTSLGLHVDATQGLDDTVECAGGFEDGRAQVVVKIYSSAKDPVDSAFYLFAALKD